MQNINFKLRYSLITLPWYSRQVCTADKSVTLGLSEVSKIKSGGHSTPLYLNYAVHTRTRGEQTCILILSFAGKERAVCVDIYIFVYYYYYYYHHHHHHHRRRRRRRRRCC